MEWKAGLGTPWETDQQPCRPEGIGLPMVPPD